MFNAINTSKEPLVTSEGTSQQTRTDEAQQDVDHQIQKGRWEAARHLREVADINRAINREHEQATNRK